MAIPAKVDILKANDSELAADFYDRLGQSGLQIQAKEQNRDADIAIISNFISPNDKVLELGCGYGRVLLPLLKKGINIYGLDVSPALIASTKKLLAKNELSTTLVTACMSETGFEANHFDKIISVWASFNHILKREKQIIALNEIHRILKPGGEAFIELVDGDTLEVKAMLSTHGFGPQKKLVVARINKDDNLKTAVFMHSKATFTEICEQSNFEAFTVYFKFVADARKLLVKLSK